MELKQGGPAGSMLLAIGGFIQDAGGNWIFVVDANCRDTHVAHGIIIMLR